MSQGIGRHVMGKISQEIQISNLKNYEKINKSDLQENLLMKLRKSNFLLKIRKHLSKRLIFILTKTVKH